MPWYILSCIKSNCLSNFKGVATRGVNGYPTTRCRAISRAVEMRIEARLTLHGREWTQLNKCYISVLASIEMLPTASQINSIVTGQFIRTWYLLTNGGVINGKTQRKRGNADALAFHQEGCDPLEQLNRACQLQVGSGSHAATLSRAINYRLL